MQITRVQTNSAINGANQNNKAKNYSEKPLLTVGLQKTTTTSFAGFWQKLDQFVADHCFPSTESTYKKWYDRSLTEGGATQASYLLWGLRIGEWAPTREQMKEMQKIVDKPKYHPSKSYFEPLLKEAEEKLKLDKKA
jgi:hypothetical protein